MVSPKSMAHWVVPARTRKVEVPARDGYYPDVIDRQDLPG
jgi:hypothetical protein